MLNPAKLAWGLATAAERRGATVLEHSRVTGDPRSRRAASTSTVDGGGVVDAGPRRRRDVRLLRLAPAAVALFVPVYDYVLMTEPLTPAQRGVDRLARPPGACPTRTTSSTTSG